MAIKEISIQHLKANLSSVIAEAESGTTVLITRHKSAVAKLGPPDSHVHPARSTDRSALKPAITSDKRIPYLEVLLEDRGDR
jgi:antitoxin (DNA-binding transcriptional repressor) of toxin-antitoxin stability system